MQVADLFALLSLKTDKGSFEKGDAFIEKIKSGAARMFAAESIRRAVRGLYDIVQGSADAADHVAKLAQASGTSSDTLQELGYVGSLADVGLDEMGTTIQRLSRSIKGAAEGSKQQADAFRSMGVAVKDAHGQLRPAEDVLNDVADHFATLPDGTKKTALAMDIMGRGAARMIPLLNGGSKEIERLKQEARDFGLVLDKDTLDQVQEFNDQQTRLGAAWKGLKFTLLKALLPTLKGIVDGMVKWVKANKEMLRQKILVLAKVLVAALKAVAKAIGFVVDGMMFLNEHWDTAKYLIYGLVAALAVYEAATIAAGVASAISWLVGLWPLGLVLLAIGLVALAVEDFYTYLQGGDSVFGDFVDSVKKYFGIDMTGAIGTAIEIAKNMFIDWWNNMKLLFGMLRFEFQMVKTVVLTIWHVVKPMIDAIQEAASALDNLTNSEFNPFGGNFAGSGTNLVQRKPGAPSSGNSALWWLPNQNIAPARGASAAVSTSIVSRPQINITVPPGADAPEIARHVKHAMKEYHEDLVRQTANGTGGGDEP